MAKRASRGHVVSMMSVCAIRMVDGDDPGRYWTVPDSTADPGPYKTTLLPQLEWVTRLSLARHGIYV
jgi:hypothetical protein